MTGNELEKWIYDYDRVLKAIRLFIHQSVDSDIGIRFDGIILAWDGRFRVRVSYMSGTEKKDTAITVTANDILPYLND